MKKIAFLVSGSGSNMQAVMERIDQGEINGVIKLVVADRNGALAIDKAKARGIETLVLDRKLLGVDGVNKALLEALKARNIELIVLGGYLSILSPEIIDCYQNQIINVHPSLIPSFCGDGHYGIKVHEKALEYGVKITGATVHFANHQTDGGPIIMQKHVYIADLNDAQSIAQRVLKVEHEILAMSVKYYCDDLIKVSGRRVEVGK